MLKSCFVNIINFLGPQGRNKGALERENARKYVCFLPQALFSAKARPPRGPCGAPRWRKCALWAPHARPWSTGSTYLRRFLLGRRAPLLQRKPFRAAAARTYGGRSGAWGAEHIFSMFFACSAALHGGPRSPSGAPFAKKWVWLEE